MGERILHVFIFPKQAWNNGDTAANLFITGATLLINMLVGYLLPLAAMAYLYKEFALFEMPSGNLSWIVAFLLYDLAWYIDHRLAHRVGFLWAMHHVHHSSTEYNTTVASRGFLVDITLLSRPTFYLLPLLGVTPTQFIAVSIITNIWGIAQHTRIIGKLKILDKVFATPSNHRVHHGSDIEYIDKNYGEVFIIWDRLFGTYKAEDQEPNYGVTIPINTNNPIKIELAGINWMIQKIRQAKNLKEKTLCLLMPPEWLPK